MARTDVGSGADTEHCSSLKGEKTEMTPANGKGGGLRSRRAKRKASRRKVRKAKRKVKRKVKRKARRRKR